MDKKREIELKLCPHCGGTDLRIGFNAVGERHYVVCSCCLMRGPEKLGDEDRAAKYWNALPRKVEALPDAKLDELEELAGKATQGGWVYEENFGGIAEHWAFVVRQDKEESGSCPAIAEMVGEERTEEDAAFIAAANPAVVLALIAEVRRHRSADDD